MSTQHKNDLADFKFRNLHSGISIGTASDRYGGWIGQIYSDGKYKIVKRSKKIGGKSYAEQVLPVASVKEYFHHFPMLELDFTYYRPLLDKDLSPTPNHHTLSTYKKHLNKIDKIFIKVPQTVFARKLWRKGQFKENPDYLPKIFNM